jgi:hypothetical protein
MNLCARCAHLTSSNTWPSAGRSFGLGYFLTPGHFEQWAASRPTHLAIFARFIAMLRQYKFKVGLRLWHEVSVLPQGDRSSNALIAIPRPDCCHIFLARTETLPLLRRSHEADYGPVAGLICLRQNAGNRRTNPIQSSSSTHIESSAILIAPGDVIRMLRWDDGSKVLPFRGDDPQAAGS